MHSRIFDTYFRPLFGLRRWQSSTVTIYIAIIAVECKFTLTSIVTSLLFSDTLKVGELFGNTEEFAGIRWILITPLFFCKISLKLKLFLSKNCCFKTFLKLGFRQIHYFYFCGPLSDSFYFWQVSCQLFTFCTPPP